MPYLVRDVMTPHSPGTEMPETVADIGRSIADGGPFTVPLGGANGGSPSVVTAIDIAMSVGRDQDPATTSAAEIAREVATISPDATVDEALELLPEHQGIAAVVEDGALVGVAEIGQVQMFADAIAALGSAAGRLIMEVSPRDTWGARMARGNTLAAGVSALECIKHAMDAAGKQEVSKLLDFPSGHGRILRVLKAAFPEAKLSAGEIDQDMVDFCAQTFGAVPIQSAENPEAVTIDESYDLIWCGSLLTHIDPGRWPGFLSLFRECLTPDGVLVFTVSGPRLRNDLILRRFALQPDQVEQVLADYDRDGFGFSGYPGRDDYGISLASPDWVRALLQDVGLRDVSYVEVGWDAPAPRQDVFACVRDR